MEPNSYEKLETKITNIGAQVAKMVNFFFGDPAIPGSQNNSFAKKLEDVITENKETRDKLTLLAANMNENDKKQAEHDAQIKALNERVSKTEQWQDRRETEAKTLVKMADVIKILGGAGGGSLIWYLIDSLVK